MCSFDRARWAVRVGATLPQRLRRRRSATGERGAVIVMVALMMTVILGIAAFAIDVGQWYWLHRRLQSAADAAALAGAYALPNAATAASTAQTYVAKNISGATATVTTPYNSDSKQIKVTVTMQATTFLAGVLGITAPTETVSAVATKSPDSVAAAVFANDTNCTDKGVDVEGNGASIPGGIYSNGTFYNGSNNGIFGWVSYGGPNNCSSTAGDGTFTDGPPKSHSATSDWPWDPRPNLPACTYSADSFTFSTIGMTIPSGVYCATGSITLSGNGMSGNVTFIANSFNLTGNNGNYTPYWGLSDCRCTTGLFAYQTGGDTMTLAGNGSGGISGVIFAPNAQIVETANNFTATGFLEGYQVKFTGNSYTLNGSGPTVGGTSAALIG